VHNYIRQAVITGCKTEAADKDIFKMLSGNTRRKGIVNTTINGRMPDFSIPSFSF